MVMRVPIDLWRTLVTKENYSEWARQAMIEKLINENNEDVINLEIKKHEDAIKELKTMKQGIPEANSVLQQKLEQSLQKFNQRNHDIAISDSQNRDWIKRIILPDLRRAGCKLNEYKLLEIFKAGRIDV